MTSSFVSSIRGCARCHGPGHENVEWKPLTHPIEDSDGTEWTHWAPCPTNGEPILMRVHRIANEVAEDSAVWRDDNPQSDRGVPD